jgi:hypothetical protein
MKFVTNALVLGFVAAGLSACSGGGATSYSLMSDGESFQQNSAMHNTKIDVLWVIDNSDSMASSQTNLANNFPAFIERFLDKNYDFQMAVTTSDAFLSRAEYAALYNGGSPLYEGASQEMKSRFRDGKGANHHGYFILDALTPDLNNNFITSVLQGTNGGGDERSFQSFVTALDNPLNAGFIRSSSFLSIILVTDEDDFSHDDTDATVNYNDARLHSINSNVAELERLTGTSGAGKRFSVNSLSINDSACKTALNNGAQKIAVRVGQLVDATEGVKASLCGDFSEELATISDSIVELSTQFYLTSEPQPSTIKVYVNGALVPAEGWVYNAEPNSISFVGAYVPEQSASIGVSFDPVKVNF